MKIRIRYILLGGFLLALSFFLIKFVFVSEEKRIARVIEAGEKSLEAKDLEGCMKRLSYNYSDEYGLSYLQIKKFLEKFFQEFQEIEIEKEILKIEVKDDEAQASMNIRVIVTIQNQRGYLIGSSESLANIKIDLEKVRTKWLVKRVEWPKRLHYQ
ncbi:MAG: hypothetical protein AABY44_06405 [Nitrospirota bacterium]